eukprot:bmy_04047T0
MEFVNQNNCDPFSPSTAYSHFNICHHSLRVIFTFPQAGAYFHKHYLGSLDHSSLNLTMTEDGKILRDFKG